MDSIAKRFFIYFLICSMTIIPEFFTLWGRIGICEVVGLFLVVTFGFSIYKREVGNLLPLFIAPIIMGCSVLNTIIVMDNPFHMTYLNVVFSYIRNIVYAVIGLYCGRILLIKDLKHVVNFFLFVSFFCLLMAWGQISIEYILDITKKIYNPMDMYSVNATWSIRPPGPFVRVFSYSFFTIIVFWLINSLPPGTIHPWLKNILNVFVIASCLISQTKGALLALIISFLFWISKDLRKILRSNFQLIFLPIILVPLIYSLIQWKDFSRFVFFKELMKLDWSGRINFYHYFQMLKDLDARFSYIEMQWHNFLTNPFLGDMYQSTIIDMYQDNLYFSQLSISGILGITVIISIFFYAKDMKIRFEKISQKYKELAFHNSVALMIYWSIISAYIFGVTNNFFVGNRAVNIIYFFWGFLEGTYSIVINKNENKQVCCV